MGVFNTFGKDEIQLKVGETNLHYFAEGDSVAGYDIPDGVYLGWNNKANTQREVVVILNQTVLFARDIQVYDKYGQVLTQYNLLLAGD